MGARPPCSRSLVDSYLTFVSEQQKQVGVPVSQATPMLEHALIDPLSDMLSRAGGGFVGGAYFSDEGHSIVLFGVLFDA